MLIYQISLNLRTIIVHVGYNIFWQFNKFRLILRNELTDSQKDNIMLQKIREKGYKVENEISVSTDTRNLPTRCIFFALKGANFDGNKFALQALQGGAALAVVDDPQYAIDDRFILVDNTLRALQELAREWREEWVTLGNCKTKGVIGITGTNGKTTTKELIAAVLSKLYNVHYTQGNLNNQIGVPLTILQLKAHHDLAIIEMGASHPGDIKELVEIAQPQFALITNVGKAHLEGFGSFEGVMDTKAELYDWVVAHKGQIFVNEDNAYLKQMLLKSIDKSSLSYDEKDEYKAGRKSFAYHTGTMLSGTHLVGDYNSENIQAAIKVGQVFDIDDKDIIEAIRDYIPSNNRSQLKQTEHNTLIIDAYNANPTSMQAAILNFIKYDTTQEKVFILGDMRELGSYSHTEHQNIVNMLLEQKQTQVLLIGEEFAKTTAPYPIFKNNNEMVAYLAQHPLTNKTILLKGSRGIHLETLIDNL